MDIDPKIILKSYAEVKNCVWKETIRMFLDCCKAVRSGINSEYKDRDDHLIIIRQIGKICDEDFIKVCYPSIVLFMQEYILTDIGLADDLILEERQEKFRLVVYILAHLGDESAEKANVIDECLKTPRQWEESGCIDTAERFFTILLVLVFSE